MCKFWGIAMTFLAFSGLNAKDVLEVKDIPNPRVQVVEGTIVVAGRTFLEIYNEDADDSELDRVPLWRFDLETFIWSGNETVPANAVISGFAILPSYHAIFVNVYGVSYKGSSRIRFYRSLLLDEKANFLGYVLDRELDDPAQVYFRNVFDVGNGELIVNEWIEHPRNAIPDMEYMQIKSIQLEAIGSNFEIKNSVSVAGKFFKAYSDTSDNKGVLVEKRPDGLLSLVYLFEDRIHYIDGTSHSKVGVEGLQLPSFVMKDADASVNNGNSEILGVHHAADGVWVAFKSRMNSRELPGLVKVSGDSVTPFRWPDKVAQNSAKYRFACFGGDVLYLWLETNAGFRLVSFDLK